MGGRAGRIISVGGGKGGVGKSLMAANLAVGMARHGAKVLLVDGDLGTPNLHTLLGMDRTGPTLNAMFNKDIAHLQDARMETGIPNLSLIPGSQATVGAANIAHAQKLKMLRQLPTLQADVVVLDVGAGVGFNALDLFNAGDLKVLVMTSQLTSIQNAYSFLKGSVHRMVRRLCVDPSQQALLDQADTAETSSLPQLLAQLRATQPTLVDALECALDHHGAFLLANMLAGPKDMSVVHAVQRMMVDYLRIPLPVLGSVRLDPALHASVAQRRPLLANPVHQGEAAVLHGVAQALLQEPVSRLRNGRAAALEALPPPPQPEVAAPTPDEQAPAPHEATPPPARQAPLPVDYGRYARKHPRHLVHTAARVHVAGKPWDTAIRDVSRGGCLLQLDAPLRVGDTALLLAPTLLGLAEQVFVVRNRRDSGQLGVEFLPPLALEEEALAVRAGRMERPEPVLAKVG